MNDFKDVQILLVEDNTSDAELTLRAMEKHNLSNKVTWVQDGAQALDYIFARGDYENRNKHHYPKLILLDLKLPKIDGLDVLRQLKSNEETKVIPVVVLTSSKEDQDKINSYKLGVNSYIVKPVDFEKFVQAVSELSMYWLLLNQPPL